MAAQFALIVLVVALRGDDWSRTPIHLALAGILVGGAALLGAWAGRGLGKGLTALPLPNGRTDLVTAGPYRWVRHPMYTAVLLGMGGVAVASGSWWSALAWSCLIVLLAAKASWEERRLDEAFPGYAAYRDRTGRFLPRIR